MSVAVTGATARSHPEHAVALAGYAVLGALLGWLRLVGLGTGGYCCDEMVVGSAQAPCLARDGVRHMSFAQYARGGAIDMWVTAPASET